jgi:type VI secretion system secreted protein Hcp
MKIKLFATFCAFALLLTNAFSAISCYMYAVGQKSGQIKGSVTQKGKEDGVEVLSVSHLITSPRDPQSGLPTGKRMHRPFTVQVRLDKSSPQFYNVLANNEALTSVQFKFWQSAAPSPGAAQGAETQDFTVSLTNATIASIKLITVDTTVDGKSVPGMGVPTLEIGFIYEKIQWNSVSGGTTSGVTTSTDAWDVAAGSKS